MRDGRRQWIGHRYRRASAPGFASALFRRDRRCRARDPRFRFGIVPPVFVSRRRALTRRVAQRVSRIVLFSRGTDVTSRICANLRKEERREGEGGGDPLVPPRRFWRDADRSRARRVARFPPSYIGYVVSLVDEILNQESSPFGLFSRLIRIVCFYRPVETLRALDRYRNDVVPKSRSG